MDDLLQRLELGLMSQYQASCFRHGLDALLVQGFDVETLNACLDFSTRPSFLKWCA